MSVDLRSFIYLDSLQPQMNAIIATISRGFLPTYSKHPVENRPKKLLDIRTWLDEDLLNLVPCVIAQLRVGVGEDPVGLHDLLKPLGRQRIVGVAIRVVGDGKATVGSLQLRLTRATCHTQERIIIRNAHHDRIMPEERAYVTSLYITSAMRWLERSRF